MTSTLVSAELTQRGRLAALRRRLRGRLAPLLYAVALAFWASSYNLRLSVLMAWMPVEPVWVASFAVALCVVHRFGREVKVEPAVAAPVVLLVLGFLPGALRASGEGYGPVKVATLVFVVLPIVVASVVLLDSPLARRGWLVAQVLVGGSVAIAALTSSHVAYYQAGRFTLASVDTISTGRMVGAAAVVLVLFALTSRKHAWWALLVAAGCGAVVVQVGSRGPLFFMLVSILVVALAARCFSRRRGLVPFAMVVIAVGTYRYAVADGGSGGQRILSEGLSDTGRAQLLSDAIHDGLSHPLGIGWGNFAEYSKTAHEIANAQGVAYAHDAFAEAFSEGGWLALAAFAVVVVLAMSRLHRFSDQPVVAIVWGTTIYWLLNALVSLDFVGNRFMWISLACALAVSRPARGADGRDERPPGPAPAPSWSADQGPRVSVR